MHKNTYISGLVWAILALGLWKTADGGRQQVRVETGVDGYLHAHLYDEDGVLVGVPGTLTEEDLENFPEFAATPLPGWGSTPTATPTVTPTMVYTQPVPTRTPTPTRTRTPTPTVTPRPQTLVTDTGFRFPFAPNVPIRISAPFGEWRGFYTHGGIDLAAGYRNGQKTDLMRKPVYAVNEGTVTFAGWKGKSGYRVDVRHEGMYGNIISSYQHLSGIGVRVGQRVTKSTLVGLVGATGHADGPHLHLGVYQIGKNGNLLAVDPARYVPIYRSIELAKR